MRQTDFTYAVARVRYKETKLLTDNDLDTMLRCHDADAVLRFLKDRGWGDSSEDETVDELLDKELERTWEFAFESVDDHEALNFLLIPNDFHNAKVAVKCITRDIEPEGIMLRQAVFAPDTLYESVRLHDYDRLPDYLRGCVREALHTLLQTSDGQLCDVIIDRACLMTVYQLGRESGVDIIERYCELYVASSDIKIAVRSAKTGKSADFLRRALAPCDTLNIDKLITAATAGVDEVIDYLRETVYRTATDALSVSLSAFEKWCDDTITDALRPQKWEPFSIGPIVAYILARENELKAARMILLSKLNALDDDIIKERLRSMYV